MDNPRSRNTGLVFTLKGEAQAMQDAAFARGETLKRADALEAVARKRGYVDWNAALAAAKTSTVPPSPAATSSRYAWLEIDTELPRLPMRILHAGDRTHDPIRELMRWAEQLDSIAEHVPEEARPHMLGLIGGEVPYVFVSERTRWADGMYRLCDRGYDPFMKIAFTREQLQEIGAVGWCDHCGTHSGNDMISLVHDDVRYTRDRVKLKQLARVIAAVAILADKLYVPKPRETVQQPR
jgi:hypothetical protein